MCCVDCTLARAEYCAAPPNPRSVGLVAATHWQVQAGDKITDDNPSCSTIRLRDADGNVLTPVASATSDDFHSENTCQQVSGWSWALRGEDVAPRRDGQRRLVAQGVP